jgi:hypothetical protein
MQAMETGDQQLVKTLLQGFTYPTGQTNYPHLLRIPSGERIPALANSDRQYVQKLIAAQIEYALKFFNIANGLSIEQVFLLSDKIVDEAKEDGLALQDVFLFLQKLTSGKMGTVFNRLDIPTFMELFEVHRQERHSEYLRAKEEIHINNKASGDPNRWSENQDREKELNHNAMAEYLKTKYNGQI